jgi:hypothetical protein
MAYVSGMGKCLRLSPVIVYVTASGVGRLLVGDREGELIVSVEADQEKSTYLLHNALNDLHPRVRDFVIAASNTGDLTEAALAAGLSQEQVAAVLPRLKVYLQRHL